MMDSKRTNKLKYPANGKKLWRVKRTVSAGNHSMNNEQTDSSNECLQNSLKISASGNQYTTKRPPLRRPKNKPGMPKDFVFVDLSPVKTESDSFFDDEMASSSNSESQISTPTNFSDNLISLFDTQLNDSFSSVSSEDDIFSNFDYASMLSLDNSTSTDKYMQSSSLFNTNYTPLGLGIEGIDWNGNSLYQQPFEATPREICSFEYPQNFKLAQQIQLQQFQQFQALLQEQMQQKVQESEISHQSYMPIIQSATDARPSEVQLNFPNQHKRSKSFSEVSKRKQPSAIQFKTYKGPNLSKKNKSIKQRSKSTDLKFTTPPLDKQIEDLEEFSILHTQFQNNLEEKIDYNTYSPISDYSSEFEPRLGKPLKSDSYGCSFEQLNKRQEEFDYNLFVSY